MAQEIARIGRTVAVEIPEELLREAGLAVGDLVEWRLTETGALELLPTNAEGRRWEEILARLTEPGDSEAGDEDEPDWTLSHGLEYKRPAKE